MMRLHLERKSTTPAMKVVESGGSAVTINGRSFDRIRELGRGSFGIVWEVREISHETASAPTVHALKRSWPTRQDLLEACLLEVEVLQHLTSTMLPFDDKYSPVPRYICHGVTTAMPGELPQVLVVMSKLEGKPLDQWLYGVNEHALKVIGIQKLLDGPLPSGKLASLSLHESVNFVAALLLQIAPVFGALSGNVRKAYHRDVSAHNFLFNDVPFAPKFSVLDFGLAVRAGGWHQEWQTRNIAGDPRYFCPAAWMQLAFGHKYLEAHPDPYFLRQYKYRIDHFAFGVLAGEVLFALWCPNSSVSAEEKSPQRLALEEAREAWRAFWKEAMGLFQRFHGEGATKVRELLLKSQLLSVFVGALSGLCKALRAVAAAVRIGDSIRLIDADIPAEAGPLMTAMAALLDWRSNFSWNDLEDCLEQAGFRSSDSRAEQGAGCGREIEAEELSPARAARGRSAFSHRKVVVSSPNPRGSLHHSHSFHRPSSPTAVGQVPAFSRKHSRQDSVPGPTPVEESPATYFSSSPSGKFSHRRSWTVDEAVSLGRGVQQVGVGDGKPPCSTVLEEEK